MHAQQGIANFASAVSFGGDITQGVEVAERFRHFLIVDQQMRAMQPVAHKFFSGHTFALRNFRFVMRKNIIDYDAVNIDLIAEQGGRHRAALDVPAGPTSTPGRITTYVTIRYV